jgi:hypothetical protein
VVFFHLREQLIRSVKVRFFSSRTLNDKLERKGFQCDPNAIDLLGVSTVDLGHIRAFVGDALDETHVLKLNKRLAHNALPRPQISGNAEFHNPVAGTKLLAKDLVLEDCANLFGQADRLHNPGTGRFTSIFDLSPHHSHLLKPIGGEPWYSNRQAWLPAFRNGL